MVYFILFCSRRNAGGRWDEEEAARLQLAKDKTQGQLQECLRELHALDKRSSPDNLNLQEMMQERQELISQIASLKAKCSDAQAKVDQLRDSLTDLEGDARHAQENLSRVDTQLQSVNATIQAIEQRVFAEWCRKAGFASLAEYEEGKAALQNDLAQRRNQLEGALQTVRNHIATHEASLADMIGQEESTKGQLLKAQSDLGQVDEALRQIHVTNSNSKATLDTIIQRQAAVADVLATLSTELNDKKRAASMKRNAAERAKNALATTEAQLERSVNTRSALIRSARLDEIPLPLTRGSLDNVPLVEHMDHSTEDPVNAIAVDYSSLSHEARGNDSGEYESRSFLLPIKAVQSELDSLAPNLRSLDKLEVADQRLKAASESYEQAREQAAQARSVFVAVRDRRLALLKPALEHLSRHISPVYRLLYGIANDSNQGVAERSVLTQATTAIPSAYLQVENALEPWSEGLQYNVQPPHKPFASDMAEQLSGGERALASLALLFTLHSYKPAPFFILDEVDAALDVANVKRLVSFLTLQRRQSTPSIPRQLLSDEDCRIMNCFEQCQFIVISLKASLYEHADALIGIYRELTHANNKSKDASDDMDEEDDGKHLLLAEVPDKLKDSVLSGSRVLSLRLSDYPEA